VLTDCVLVDGYQPILWRARTDVKNDELVIIEHFGPIKLPE